MINPADITIETWPPRLKGGQHVGTGPSGVKITHAAGIEVCVNTSRSQAINRSLAMEALEGAMTSQYWGRR